MKKIHQREVIEFRTAPNGATFTAPDGSKTSVPAFQKADGLHYARYASAAVGTHACVTGDGAATTFEVVPYSGDNPLYKHGAVRAAANRRHLEHEDGTPFFYLADTWWMGLCKRLTSDGFAELAADRVAKGFTAVHIVAGLYPDMHPFDPRGANDAGFPWDEKFTTLNPTYFDAADARIKRLVESGLAPVIVGCWGFFAKFAGVDVIKRHWEHLVARWAAYPVIWCAAGEATMPFYTDPDLASGKLSMQALQELLRANWTDIAGHLRAYDPFRRLVTIHPTQNGHEQVNDESLLDLDWLQTGHQGAISLQPTLKMVKAALDRRAMPVVNSEVCYEGIGGSSHADVQRYLFASNVLLGCCGHGYAANGIWQVNSRAEPYGPSPHGASWGDTPWEDAMRLPGSAHIGHIKRFLMAFDWWRFEPHPEWVPNPCNCESLWGVFCAGIPNEARVIFKPWFGGCFWGDDDVLGLDGPYHAYYFDPIAGAWQALGLATPDANGRWKSPRVKIFQDWLLALSKKPLDCAGARPGGAS